jgi:hypothetical protein
MNKIKLQGTKDEGRRTKGNPQKRPLPTAYCLLLTVYSLLFTFSINAQEGNTIHQDESLKNLLEKYRDYQQKVDVTDGYRIQITYTTDRDEAYKAKARLYKEFETASSYIEYEQPNYKLRVGDFKTRLEATAFLQQVILLYPGAFIAKDKVKIK